MPTKYSDSNISQEDFNNDISDNEDSGDMSSENDSLSEDDIFIRDNILTESSMLSEDDMLIDDNMFSTDRLMSKDNVLREVVNESLCSETMLSVNREFALYVSNITEALIKYYSGDFVVCKESTKKRIGCILAIVQKDSCFNINIQCILTFEELPKNLQSNSHKERSIREILYKHNNKWKIRNVIYSYKHPSEFAMFEEPTSSLQVYKLYIDIYYNNFSTFHNVYHSLGGVYIQIGNIPFITEIRHLEEEKLWMCK
ncbi:8643_t:CDS:2, partial [Gigaspora margarita]